MLFVHFLALWTPLGALLADHWLLCGCFGARWAPRGSVLASVWTLLASVGPSTFTKTLCFTFVLTTVWISGLLCEMRDLHENNKF